MISIWKPNNTFRFSALKEKGTSIPAEGPLASVAKPMLYWTAVPVSYTGGTTVLLSYFNNPKELGLLLGIGPILTTSHCPRITHS